MSKPSIRFETVRTETLKPVAVRQSLPSYLAALWQRRHFIIADSRARVAGQGQQMRLGQAWLVLKPLLDAAVYFIIFALVLKTDRGIDNFIGYLIIGVFLFQFSTRSLTQGGTSLVRGRSLIQAFTFPRASIPAATVVRETISMLPVVATMFVLLLVIPTGTVVSWRWALFPLIFVMQMVFNFGLALIAARIVFHVNDLQHVIAFLARFWFYASAVFFSPDRFMNSPTFLMLMKANPLFQVLDMSRDVLIYGATPPLNSWLTLLAWAVGSVVVGMLFFWSGEEHYGKPR